ncbi:MAG: sensor histidine kinase [Streptosporangiales bacterium]|nr:sensor histidine kinase [Streptosporangiales bacterium]
MTGRLGGVLGLSRTGLPWRDWRVLLKDLVLWLALALPTSVALFLPRNLMSLWWTLPANLLFVAVLVALSRLRPLVGLCVALLAAVAWEPNYVYAMPVMTFLAGRWQQRPQPALVTLSAIAVVGTVVTPLLGFTMSDWANGVLILLITGVFPWLVGRSWRQYQELVRAGWERAEQLEREQRIVGEQARLRERARIAQDMHDSLGHELSLLGLRAGALEVDPDLAERHQASARDIRQGAASATERLHEIIGVLRDEAERAPIEPAHESVEELVDRAAASGLPVTLHRDGDGVEVPVLVDRAAHRVVQEALTNATKHAPGTAVDVRLASTATETVVTVVNALAPARDATAAATTGQRGLVGLRERVRLLGGTLRAGERDAAFEVEARLPHEGGAASAPEPLVRGTGESESTRHLARARRRVRRSFVTVVVVPGAILVILGVVTAAQYTYSAYASMLPAEDYAGIRVGQSRTALESVLPEIQYTERPRVVEPEVPAGADCEYYRVTRNPFNLPSDVYRLCFVDGRLASKDLIDGESPRPVTSSTP